MSKFKMDFYWPNGVVATHDCKTEQKYLLVKAFLQDLVGGPTSPEDVDRIEPVFYYLESDQQKDALYGFLRELREKPES